MADEGTSDRSLIEVQAIAIVQGPRSPVDLDPMFIDELVDLLDLSTAEREAFPKHLLELAARQYIIWRPVIGNEPPTAMSKRALRDLANRLAKARASLDKLSSIQKAGLACRLDDDTAAQPGSRTLFQIEADLQRLESASANLADEFRTKKGARSDRFLRLTILALMWLLEEYGGGRPTVSMTKTGSHEPRLTSLGARVIARLLTHVDPALTELTIIHRIHDCRSEPDLSRFKPFLASAHGSVVPH